MTSAQATLREMKVFEFYKTKIWPIHRLFVKRHLTPRCSRCFLPQSYTVLEKGICKLCLTDKTENCGVTKENRNHLQAELDCIMAKVLSKKNIKFHALILLSGGKDSSFMLHRLKTLYPKLRILAMTLDNTFMSPVALDNIATVIRTTGVDHIMVRPAARLMEKMFKAAFSQTDNRGCAAVVDQFDGDFFSDAARNLAAQMGIPYIFCGLSRDQVRHILKLDSFIADESTETKTREQVAGIPLTRIFGPQEMGYWWDGRAWPREKRPRMIFPFFIWDYEESYIRSKVLELGLLQPGKDSPLVTNSSLIPLMGLVDMARLGYSSFEPEFARMVRQGKADRKEWLFTFETLEYAARTGRFLGRSVNQVMDRLSLTPEDLGIGGQSND